jgi:PHD/YefM family antitoxin component YafN of YafNO toxin-antitoxin module
MIEVANDELQTVRDAMRSLNAMVDDLQTGRRAKVVLMRHNQMQAVVLPIETYARLAKGAKHWEAQ